MDNIDHHAYRPCRIGITGEWFRCMIIRIVQPVVLDIVCERLYSVRN